MATSPGFFNTINRTIQQNVTWILAAIKRLFSPTDDDYPETGVQPFDGDLPEQP